MISKDIEFEILNENNENINCCVVATFPMDEETVNIMYKREDEEPNIFRYGKIIKKDDTFLIKKDLTDEEYINLREKFDEEILNIAQEFLNQMEVE